MEKREWTKAQESAMEKRDRTLLVSAAAGSGKTAVLTERIIRTLTDKEHPADISRMLVVTFTRAAAGELRHRIAKALSAAITLAKDKTHLSRQLMLLGGASISTIDSFYYDLVRTHFEEAGIPASLRLSDENELLGLKRELMNAVVDKMYAENADFFRISDILCDIRSEAGLTDALLKIYNRLLRYPAALDVLLQSAEQMERCTVSPLDTPWGKIWEREVRELAETGQKLYAKTLNMLESEADVAALKKKFGGPYQELLERCNTVLEHLDAKNYEGVRHALSAKLERGKGRNSATYSAPFGDLCALCDEFRDKWKAKHTVQLPAFSEAEIADTAKTTAALLRILHRALTLFHEEYTAAKTQREVAEFSDISRAAYRLLVAPDGSATPLAEKIRDKYDAIYIDEYQDVDSMQDATFRAIAKDDNRFMVGDIKQSIYRFRGAQPNVFAGYRRAFPPLSDTAPKKPSTIFMSECFRCDPCVIDFSNAVSGDLFSAVAESISYTKEDDLRCSKKLPSPDYVGEKCRVVLINRAKFGAVKNGEEDALAAKEAPSARYDEEESETGKAEALWIACEIKRLLCEDERKANGERIAPRDIAVLMRSTTLARYISNHLAAFGIPCNDTSHKNFFENPDVLCVYSLLAALDNPFRDVYMAAALRSPFFGFSLEDLVQIRAAAGDELSLYEAFSKAAESEDRFPHLREKLRDFSARFLRWREKAQALPVDRLLRYLYRDSAILSFAGRKDETQKATALRRANLNRLYEYARSFESGGFKGLYQFVRYVDGIMENEGKMPASDGEEDAVSLITIHHSKGLEYPVCFIAGTATRFNEKDLQQNFMDDEDLGCAMRLSNAGPFSRANTFFREAIVAQTRRRNLEEEMRVLYVAMTRARERLYVTADSQYGAAQLIAKASLAASAPEGRFVCAHGPAYIYWVLSALYRTDYTKFATIEIVEEAQILPPAVTEAAQSEAKLTGDAGEISKILQDRFSFTYPYKHLSKLPAKLSVSRLSPTVLDVYDTDATTPEHLKKADVDLLLHDFDKVPTFALSTPEQDAAARGTATHEFMQFCQFARAEAHGVKAELKTLIEMAYLPPESAELVRVEELELFFRSEFYRSLKNAKALYRETRFHIFLPAAQFTKDEEFSAELKDEKLAVQGVIDLFYYDENDKLVLCDYKTDRLSPAQLADKSLAAKKLKERHGDQLSYYAKALEEICGRRPDKILIYSLPLGEALEIN
ncbi:MAG: hypothetical protein E7624_03290 [Ruminococcaceae bacterium]|nr:hypothetical protein [Oscillospiraceae bacterium]